MKKAHWKGTEKIRRFLFMGFFSLLILSIGFFIGTGDSQAGAKKRDKTAVSSASFGVAGKKESFHEFLSYKNVSYPSVYPNHFYDAYVYPSNRRGEVLGTIIYIHGGGFVSGTKDIAGENPYFLSWLRAGFQVISIDYALAPDYPYPTALHQISYCVEEILRLKDSLGIDERKLIFMGDSAGASLAGQFILTQVNKGYGKMLGISPFMAKKGAKICAFISLSGLLDGTRYHKTGLQENDVAFLSWGQAYFRDKKFYSGKKAEETKLEDYLTKAFPPTFLTDGNVGSFRTQAEDFKEKCRAVGIPVVTYFPDGEIPHDYELRTGFDEAEKSLEKQIHFARFLLS